MNTLSKGFRIVSLSIFLLAASACGGDESGDGDGGKSGSGGTSGSSGSSSGTGGASGGTTGGAGATGAGTSGSGGSAGTAGAGTLQCTPDTSFTGQATCIQLPGSVPPESYALGTAMTAGQPYAVVVEVTGTMSPTLEIWGTNGECAAGGELLGSRLTAPGFHCFELSPTAAHTHVLLAKQGNVFGSGVAPRDFCPGGSCP